MKPWFEQEAAASGLAGALKNLLRYANHPAAEKTIQNMVKCPSETPESVRTTMAMLAEMEVPARTYFITLDQLAETRLPHISFIRDTINDTDAQWPILISAVNEEDIRYIHPVKGIVIEAIGDFSQK